MEKQPLVTIYIVNHNYGRFIEKAIESVLSQSHSNIQLIIIDNGSKDHSRQILRKLKPQQASVIFQKNKGLIAANNLAIKLSKGKYIMRLDADDWLKKNAVTMMVKEFKRNKQIGLVFSNYYEVDENENISKEIKRYDFQKVKLLDRPAHGACTMFKSELFKKVGYYDEEFDCQDGFDIWLKFIKKYKVKSIKKSLWFYRQHGSNLTKNENKILKARNKIIIKNKKKRKLKNIIAIIPVRGPKYETPCLASTKLKNKMLIERTINFASKCEFIKKIFISSSDVAFLNKLKKKYKNIINVIHRDENLIKNTTDIMEVIKDLDKKMSNKNFEYDGIFKLSVEGLFRDKDELNAMIAYMEIFKVDKVLGVRIENDNFYKHDGNSLKALSKTSPLRLERDDIFREINHTFLLSKKGIKRKVFKIGHIVLNQLSSFSIRSDFDLDLAKQIIKNKIN